MKNLCALFLIIVAVAACTPSSRKGDELARLYRQIDIAIANDNQGIAKVDSRLAALKGRWASAVRASSPAPGSVVSADSSSLCSSLYSLADSIFQEYSSYDNDSAVAWALLCRRLAMQSADPHLLARASLNLAGQYTRSGCYTEACRYFQPLRPDGMPEDIRVKYYDTGCDLYGNMGHSSEDQSVKAAYIARSAALRDTLFAIAPHRSAVYLRNRLQHFINTHNTAQVLRASNQWLSLELSATNPSAVPLSSPHSPSANPQTLTHSFAIVAYYRSEAYRVMGDTLKRKEWLAKSAIADISSGVMDQASLWTLAAIIYREGDIDRAYRYMAHSWQSLSKFSSRKRTWDVMPVLTVINNTYQQKAEQARHRLTAIVVLVIALLAVSLSLLLYVQHKRRQLAEAQQSLAESNRQLRNTIAELHHANTALQCTNAALHESDRVKDKYIGQFFAMCSSYIEKLDNFRSKVRRSAKEGDMKTMEALTDPVAMKAAEHKALLSRFDDIFLSLYPSFVDEFNSLLRPGCAVRPSGKERLNATLRIFALIRLGINKSSRIADILGLSPASVYNYRAQAKNMAACPRAEFEDRVKTPAAANPQKQ